MYLPTNLPTYLHVSLLCYESYSYGQVHFITWLNPHVLIHKLMTYAALPVPFFSQVFLHQLIKPCILSRFNVLSALSSDFHNFKCALHCKPSFSFNFASSAYLIVFTLTWAFVLLLIFLHFWFEYFRDFNVCAFWSHCELSVTNSRLFPLLVASSWEASSYTVRLCSFQSSPLLLFFMFHCCILAFWTLLTGLSCVGGWLFRGV